MVGELLVCEEFKISETASGFDSACMFAKAMRKSFRSLDLYMKTGGDHFTVSNFYGGSTAIVALVTPTHIVIANTGDSRFVLFSGPNARVRFFTKDHKPENYVERERIEAAGGYVMYNRINGDLAVSRAFGDFQFKCAKLPESRQQVISDPDVTVLQRFADDYFMILACDGIWDVMSIGDVSDFIRAKLVEGLSLSEICNSLIHHCLKRGSRDNMSVLLVRFNPQKYEMDTVHSNS